MASFFPVDLVFRYVFQSEYKSSHWISCNEHYIIWYLEMSSWLSSHNPFATNKENVDKTFLKVQAELDHSMSNATEVKTWTCEFEFNIENDFKR